MRSAVPILTLLGACQAVTLPDVVARYEPDGPGFFDTPWPSDARTTPEGGDFSFAARGSNGGEFAWRGRFALEPMVVSFMREEPDEAAGLHRSAIPVPKGPVDVW